jgi:hypothetical protein
MAFRSEFTDLMTRDLYGWFLQAYDQLSPVYPQIFDVQPLVGAYAQETQGIGLGQLSERTEGNEIIASNPLEGYTVLGKARTFSDSFFLTMEFVEDATPQKMASVMSGFASTWAQGVVNSKETFAAKFFIYGGFTAGRHDTFDNSITGVVSDSSGDLIYTGKPFFALTGNNHPAKDGSTYYNSLGALSLTSANLQTAYNLMTNTNNYDERGEKISLRPDVLLIPPALRFTAKTILESELQPSGANNDINVTQNLVSQLEWQYLTDTNGWFLGTRQKGLKFYERKAPVIDFYQDETSKKYYATIDARWGGTVDEWRHWVAANISTS